MISLCSSCCLSLPWKLRVWITNMVTHFMNWGFYKMRLNNRTFPNYYNDNAELEAHSHHKDRGAVLVCIGTIMRTPYTYKGCLGMITDICCMSRLGSNNCFIAPRFKNEWNHLTLFFPMIHHLSITCWYLADWKNDGSMTRFEEWCRKIFENCSRNMTIG